MLFDCNNYCNNQLSTCQIFRLQFSTPHLKTERGTCQWNTYTLSQVLVRSVKQTKNPVLYLHEWRSVNRSLNWTRLLPALPYTHTVLHLSLLIHISKYPWHGEGTRPMNLEKYTHCLLPFITAVPRGPPPAHLSPQCQGHERSCTA